MKTLYLIPARGGSKGLPGKNIKELNGKALINHSVDFARNFTDDNNICVSTDSNEIIECVENNNLKVHFKRPSELASDTASTIEVIKHAISYYESKGIMYDNLILLQPTTPFRKIEDLANMIAVWNNKIDLLVSVKETHDSPYFNIFEENLDGFLEKSKDVGFTRRQDAPKVYAFNGSIYIYKVSSI
ncbi:acylneuraminate cytidylyltransferase family protein, partial [Flavobacteriaceae bacterium]|nr:acylneuraminate cytidylyltransferase family protein [Flavobacteriaceae bacterium]